MRRGFAVAVLLWAVTAIADDCRRGFFGAERAVTLQGRAVVGDFDEDGRPDFAAQGILVLSGSLAFLNRGNGVFQPVRTQYNLTNVPPPLVDARDVNGDGHVDLILQDSTFVDVMLGDGHGGFAPPVFAGTMRPLDQLYAPDKIAYADIDGDGVSEWITLDQTNFYIWKLTPAVTMQKVATVTRGLQTPNGPQLSIGDYDGDGRMDVMAATFKTLEIFTQQADHSFVGHAFVGTASPGPVSLDVDGNGAEVVALPQEFGHLKLIRVRDGQLSVRTIDVTGLPASARNLRMFDVDHDGLPDLVFTSPVGGATGIAWASARGVFGPVAMFDTLGSDLAIADIDGDGIEDLLTISSMEGITVLHGKKHSRDLDGAQVFANGLVTYSGVARDGVTADFDGDGKPDFAAVDASGNVSIVYGNGRGGFDLGPLKAFGTNVVDRLAAADFDGDGKVDLAMSGPNGAQILFGDGVRAFGATSLSLGAMRVVAPLRSSAYASPALIVVTQDGQIESLTISSGRTVTAQSIGAAAANARAGVTPGGDLVTVTGDTMSIYTWNGEWNMRDATQFIDRGATTADLNGDGITDVITGRLEVFLGQPDGSFRQHWFAYPAGFIAKIIVTDVDRDGHPDLVIVDSRNSNDAGIVEIERNDGSGSFTPYGSTLAGDFTMSHSFAIDADQDGWPDIVMLTMNGIEVLRNVCAPPRVRVAIVPARPVAGQSVSFLVHALSTSWFTVGEITATENGETIADGNPYKVNEYATLLWSSLPLAAGHHVYTIRYADGSAGASQSTFEFDVAAPAAHRRAVR